MEDYVFKSIGLSRIVFSCKVLSGQAHHKVPMDTQKKTNMVSILLVVVKMQISKQQLLKFMVLKRKTDENA